MVELITGGAASGKSAYAEGRAAALGKGGRILYSATMYVQSGDTEGEQRIARHREMRAGKGFLTVETPVSLEPLRETCQHTDTVLLECLSNLLANRIYLQGDPDPVVSLLDELDKTIRSVQNLIVVSNEIFSDINGYSEETQAYIHALGRLNQALAARAERVTEIVFTIPILHKEGGTFQ